MRQQFSRVMAGAAILLISGTAATAEVITLRDGLLNPLTNQIYTGTEDTTLYSGAPGGSYGGNDQILIGTRNTTSPRRALLRFDLSSLAGEYASIDKVTLQLTLFESTNSNAARTTAFGVYSVADDNAAWQQGTTLNGADAAPGESTWNHRLHDTVAWSGGAGLGTTGYNSAALASATYEPTTQNSGDVLSIELPASLIEQWITGTNAGMLFKADAEVAGTGLPGYGSSENATASIRPTLIVEYSVPEPAGLAVLGLVGILAGRRRR